jgi:hypothetical protein
MSKVNLLTSFHSFSLYKEVEQNYVTSKLNDEDFAKATAKKLGFPVTTNNVSNSRRSLGIPPTQYRRTGVSGKFGANKRIDALERLVDAMRAELGMPTVQRNLP